MLPISHKPDVNEFKAGHTTGEVCAGKSERNARFSSIVQLFSEGGGVKSKFLYEKYVDKVKQVRAWCGKVKNDTIIYVI